ncbi:MAG: hypothetical protein LBT81_01685, partial [Helicobacteraceae bacterium]|nr:hypothetical protein [Helicobacteraceae bacterium]
MNAIKFSSPYVKLWDQTSAELLSVRQLAIPQDLSPSLRRYDTLYPATASGFNLHEIKNGDYLQLIFVGDLHVPFCAIRRRTPGRERYYKSRIG